MARRTRKNLTNNHVAFLAVAVMLVSSLATIFVLDVGGFGGAATTAQGDLTITVGGATACTLTNSTVAFGTMAQSETKSTDGNSIPTLVINNSGNILINVSINTTNTSLTMFSGGSRVTSDYQMKGGNLCSSYGTIGTAFTSYTDVSTSHRNFVKDLDFTNGADVCDVEIQIHIPNDEPVGSKRDKINFNCTNG